MTHYAQQISGRYEMAEAIREFPWNTTVLGDISEWDTHFTAHVNMMLACPFPMIIWWGNEKVQLYNDACRKLIGSRYGNGHPAVLGARAKECWAEAWELIQKKLDVLETDPHGVFEEDKPIPLYNNGQPEEVYWTFSYSRLQDSEGTYAGTLIIFKETSAANRELRRKKEEKNFLLTITDKLQSRSETGEIEACATHEVREYFHADGAGFATFDIETGFIIKDTENLVPTDNPAVEQQFSVLPLLSTILKDKKFAYGRPWISGKYTFICIPVSENSIKNRFFYVFHEKHFDWNEHRCAVLAEAVQKTEEVISAVVARQQIILSEYRYRALFESIDDAFMVIDFIYDEKGKPVNYTFINTNPAFETQSGLTNVTGKTILEIMPDVETVWIETYGHVSVKKKPIQFEQYNEGTQKYYEVFASPVRECPGQVVVVFRDVTDKKREIEMKNNFLSLTSHELKTPLTSIYTYFQLAQRMNTTEQYDKASLMLEKAGNHLVKMTSIINSFLELSRLEESSAALHETYFDIGVLTETCLKEARMQYTNHRFSIHTESPVYVSGDQEKLMQVIQHMISNAVKYSERNTLISVGCRTSGDRVKISIEDQGIGIAETAREEIFKKFYRVNDNPITGVSGFGLGLYLSNEILKLHQTRLEVHSMVNRGSVFHFSLPVIKNPAKPV